MYKNKEKINKEYTLIKKISTLINMNNIIKKLKIRDYRNLVLIFFNILNKLAKEIFQLENTGKRYYKKKSIMIM